MRQLVAVVPMSEYPSTNLLTGIRFVYQLRGWRNVEVVAAMRDDPVWWWEVQVFAGDDHEPTMERSTT